MGEPLSVVAKAILRKPVDPSVVAVLPEVEEIVNVAKASESAWAWGFRIDVRHSNDRDESYFMKVSLGYHGREALKGEFEATSAIYAIKPDFCPRPIAWGTLTNHPDAHFYLCKFYHFAEGRIPHPNPFCQQLAELHSAQSSPEGKFGFHCTTYNGDLPQDNTWSDSWEAFFDNGLRHVLKVREERAEPNAELDALLPALFEKVIPRLLRPLESGGRKIQPSLVHGDLWYGNAAVVKNTGEPIVFDPASFYAHNEYELGNWRPKRNKFDDRSYFETYLKFMGCSEPSEDFDYRNALYGVRFNLHAATLFPGKEEYLKIVINEVRQLAEKYPDGYVEDAKRAPTDA